MIGFQSLAFSWTLSSQKWSAVQSHGKQEKWGGRLLSPCCSQNEDGVQRTPLNKTEVRHSWVQLIRWSKTKQHQNGISEIDLVSKVAVFGGGSFGTAMGVALARKKESLKVQLLLRNAQLVKDINEKHVNTKYLPVCTHPSW